MEPYETIKVGIGKYRWIMSHVHETDVSTDAEFQKRYNGFYRVRQRSANFYRHYFSCLEENKNNHNLTFEDVVLDLYQKTGEIHASFGSKLLATVNPDMPIWDQFVLKNLGLRAPYYYEKNRMEKIVRLYDKLCDWYKSEEAKKKQDEFERMFPDEELTDVKKTDFVLWATR